MKRGLPRTFRALAHRNYRLFFTGQGLSVIGTWLQQVAMGWLTYRLTNSAWLLGVVAFCANVGILLFGNVAGVVADRIDRRRGLLTTQSLMLAQAVVLAVLVAFGWIETWHLIVLALWLGTCSAFDTPLRQSMYVHFIADRGDLGNAIALNSMLVNTARVVGPALAGLLLGLTNEAICFALNALSFLAVIIAIAKMDWPADIRTVAATGWWASWIEGVRYAQGLKPVRALLVLVAALAWTISPYSSLMPVYAKDIYGGGPHTLGYLLSAAGLGALASTLHLAHRATVRGLGRVIMYAVATSGAALAAFAYMRIFPIALLLMVLVGGGTILAAASANTILQTIVDDRLRGRVAAFYTLAFLGVAPLGNLAAGAIAAAMGTPFTFALNGVLAMLAALWYRRKLPMVRSVLRPIYEALGVPPRRR
ncbi:MAG TPA: MFS transporter [Casimicrobiaceae bacterium]|nr:MFS transporter [Casimicrobiaceae bacterium]HXU65912.1 MFS transporter [Casimicrobiaceae bacterium]